MHLADQDQQQLDRIRAVTERHQFRIDDFEFLLRLVGRFENVLEWLEDLSVVDGEDPDTIADILSGGWES